MSALLYSGAAHQDQVFESTFAYLTAVNLVYEADLKPVEQSGLQTQRMVIFITRNIGAVL